VIKLVCKKCGKNGIPLFKKIVMRKGHNVRCEECFTEYNYSWWSGALVSILAAALGTILFYLVIFVNSIGALILWVLIAMIFSGLILLLVPLNEIKNKKGIRNKGVGLKAIKQADLKKTGSE